MKIKILHHPTQWSNVTANFLLPLYQEHFDVEPIDYNKTYDKNSCVIYTHWINNEWTTPWHEQRYKIVVDHLWDPWQNLDTIRAEENKLVLRSDGWFCIANECLWYKSLGLDSYTSTAINDKSFLMLMNYQRPHRDQIWDRIQPYLADALYSYRAIGVKVADDISIDDPRWQRHLNPEWYNRTKYSLVVETGINGQLMEHSEKVLKPIAFKHPMIVWGPPGYLKWVRSWGFETFDHLIDEGYDSVNNDTQRLDLIINEVAVLNTQPKNYFEDAHTYEILDHNYNRFYDVSWAQQQFREKVTEVIKDFVETC
jgi:hypothetical protein